MVENEFCAVADEGVNSHHYNHTHHHEFHIMFFSFVPRGLLVPNETLSRRKPSTGKLTLSVFSFDTSPLIRSQRSSP